MNMGFEKVAVSLLGSKVLATLCVDFMSASCVKANYDIKTIQFV